MHTEHKHKSLFLSPSLALSVTRSFLLVPSLSFVSLRPTLQCAYIQHNIAIIKYSSVWSQFWHDSYSINSFSKVLFFLFAILFLLHYFSLSLCFDLCIIYENDRMQWQNSEKIHGINLLDYTHTHTVLHGWAELMAAYWYAVHTIERVIEWECMHYCSAFGSILRLWHLTWFAHLRFNSINNPKKATITTIGYGEKHNTTAHRVRARVCQ